MAGTGGGKRHLLPIGLGVMSAFLYGSRFMALAYLLPIQAAGARRGWKAMALSALSAAAVLSAMQLAPIAAGRASSPAMTLVNLVTPLAMIAALALMALPALGAVPFTWRALGGALAASLAVFPCFALAAKDPAVRALFDELVAQAPEMPGGALDPGALWETLAGAMASGLGAVIFLLLFASALSGSRFAFRPDGTAPARDGDAAALPPELHAYKVPQGLVWLLLGSWAAILLTRYLPMPAVKAVAWNVAVSLSICYALQGLAVSFALAGRIGMATVARALGPIALVLLVASGTAGFIALGLLALLGTLETWIPFRTEPKGELP